MDQQVINASMSLANSMVAYLGAVPHSKHSRDRMGMVLQDWLDEQQLVLTKQGDADQDNLYYVLWDTSCQCELFKGTHAEVRQAQDNEVGGAGAGFIYPCIIGYTLTSTKGRTNDTGLVLTMESKDTLNVIEERAAKIIDETI